MEEILDVVKVTGAKGGQRRITLKKSVAEELGADVGDYLLFIKKDGEIVIRKLKVEGE